LVLHDTISLNNNASVVMACLGLLVDWFLRQAEVGLAKWRWENEQWGVKAL
jgi:hypothetical protein